MRFFTAIKDVILTIIGIALIAWGNTKKVLFHPDDN